jgi:dTDP-4-amino-4,6-dideoxygalactose transaminase
VLAARYLQQLDPDLYRLPLVTAGAEPIWHLFVVRSPSREKVLNQLQANGIGSMIHYPIPPHLQPAYAELGLGEGTYPISESIHREVLSLPLWPQMSMVQQDYVIEILNGIGLLP